MSRQEAVVPLSRAVRMRFRAFARLCLALPRRGANGLSTWGSRQCLLRASSIQNPVYIYIYIYIYIYMYIYIPSVCIYIYKP